MQLEKESHRYESLYDIYSVKSILSVYRKCVGGFSKCVRYSFGERGHENSNKPKQDKVMSGTLKLEDRLF